MEDITVSIPARAEFVHVLRSVIASVAALVNFPYDGIDDLRIAVDEACAHLLSVGGRASTLSLRIKPSPSDIQVVSWIDAGAVDWPPPGARESLTWQVLSALADDAAFEQNETGPAIRFSKRLPALEA